MARTNRGLQQMPVAMEIGATPNIKKGRGVGKDLDAKGKEKGGKKGKGDKGGTPKGSTTAKGNNLHANMECRYCQKMGHIKANFRKRIAVEIKDTKGKKGSGKARTHAAAPDQEQEPASAMVDLIQGSRFLSTRALGIICFQKGLMSAVAYVTHKKQGW